MIDYLSEIRGDFSISAISLRLYAPDSESLFKFMPDGNENQRIENWEDFSRKIDWSQEIQSILYVANFVHEFVHLLQHTTLFQCMFQVEFYHSITWSILKHLEKLKNEDGIFPPQIPLLNWLFKINNHDTKEIHNLWTLGNVYHNLYLGNEEFAKHYCQTVKADIKELFIEPFNPRIKHLNSNFTKFDDVPIDTAMLLESQATTITFRFISSFYGEKYAHDFVLGNGSKERNIRKDYDILPIVSIADDMLYLMPLVIDWALEGACFSACEEEKVDYSAFHPPWRFARLYNAAKEFKNQNNLKKLDVFNVLKDVSEIKAEIFNIAHLEEDSPDDLSKWINKIDNEILKKVFQRNILFKLEHPEAYAYFESNFALIGKNTYIPITFFRDNPYTNFHSPMYSVKDDILDAGKLSFFTQRAFDLNRMIEGLTPKCPFCQGLEYELPNGRKEKKYPPAGQRGIITEQMIVSKYCNCAWGWGFKDFWGILPEDIEHLN